MGDIFVHLATAMLCFAGTCHPTLIGKATPVGVYPITWRKTNYPGYGGDILEFKLDNSGLYAIHRVWLLSPKQHRLERLTSGSAKDRRNVSGGCINVEPEIYTELVDCCSRGTLTITEK